MSIDRSIVAKLDDVLATIAFIWDHFSIMDAVELRQPSSRGRGSPGCNLIVPRLRRRGNHDDGNSHSENRLPSFFISLRNIVYALMTKKISKKNFLSSSRNIFIFLSLKFHLYLVQTSIRDSLLLLLLENERALSLLHRV